MSANSAAFDHVNGFRWRLGDPALADSEAHLYDLGVLSIRTSEGHRYCAWGPVAG